MKPEIFKAIQGKVKRDEPLDRHTTIRIGGLCDYWIEPKDTQELKVVLGVCGRNGIPAFVVGKGGHLLVNDRGFRGAVINLNAPSFKKLKISENRVVAGAGMSLAKLIKATCESGLGGLESLTGIPGTVGGAVFMNAGGWKNPVYETIGTFVESVRVIDFDGKSRKISKKNLDFKYRDSNLYGCVIVEVFLKLKKQDSLMLINRSRGFLKLKKDKQVLDFPSAGCVFKNPKDLQFTSGQLIDMMGLKGRKAGGAQISEKHANFIINLGQASFDDVMTLVHLVEGEAKRNYGVSLELEVKII